LLPCWEGYQSKIDFFQSHGALLMQRYLILGTVAFAAALIVGTLAPVGLPYALYYKPAPWLGHPSMRTYATIEHLFVFAAFGALFRLSKSTSVHLLLGASGGTFA
jgi:hypothetical protein